MRRILSFAPLDLVDLLFDLERLEVVKFGLVGLEFGVELVFTCFFLGRLNQTMTLQRSGHVDLTVSFLSNNTTRPPLSPVAK